MSLSDDCCDFCGKQQDLMGNDRCSNTADGFWCGFCREGRDALWGEWSVAEVIARRDKLQADYDADPIDWERYPKRAGDKPTVEEFRAHLRRLDRMDGVAWLNEVLKDRAVEV